MERRPAPAVDAASIIGLLGGALLIVGAQLSWGTISINLGRFAAATGVAIGQVPQGLSSLLGSHGPVPGLVLTAGKVALNCGILALIAAIPFVFGIPRRVTGSLLALAGVVGGGFAVYYAINPSVTGVDQVGSVLNSLGLHIDFKSLLDVSIGMGVWICIAGGLLAIAGGVMSLMTAAPTSSDVEASTMPPVPSSPPSTMPDAGGVPPTT